MTQSTAVDYVDQGIRCHCICLDTVEFPFVEAYLQQYHAREIEETRQALHARQPLGRMDRAACVTGTQRVIDGGLTAR